MKRISFLLILLALASVRAWACGPEVPNYDAHVFRLCPNPQHYARNNDMRLAEAWSQLLGVKVTVAQSRQLADVTLAELDTLSIPLVRQARKSKEVNDYLHTLVAYLQATSIFSNPWDYPSPEEVDAYRQQLNSLLSTASQYRGQQLAERYALLRLRILFRQQAYSAIIIQWEQHPLTSGSVFADMARDLYAGALYHSGRVEDAAVQYAISGNMFDAHLCMRGLRGASCMSRIIAANPNSPVLPYMVEEMVNGFAESINYYRALSILHPIFQRGACFPFEQMPSVRIPMDCYDLCSPDSYDSLHIAHLPTPDEWFSEVRPFQVTEQEILHFQSIIENQLANSQVQDRCMWLSAKAYMQYLQKNYDVAWALIGQAVKAPGTPQSQQNALYLRLLCATRHSSLKTMESTLVQGLNQLHHLSPTSFYDWAPDTSADGSYQYYSGSTPVTDFECLAHLVSRGIVDRYLREGDSVMATLAWSLLCRQYYSPDENLHFHLPTFGDEHYHTLCNLSHAGQLSILHMVQHPGKVKNPLAQYILSRNIFSAADYLDVIGTNLIRDGRFEQAIPYLQQVPLSFLSQQNIAPYAAVRNVHQTPWECVPVNQYDDTTYQLTTNAKLDYCRLVLQAQRQFQSATGESRYQAAYDLGLLYHQASVQGHCWWLAYYGVSTLLDFNLDLQRGHFNFLDQSRQLLSLAMGSSNPSLRYQAAYLALFQGRPDYLHREWDFHTDTYRFTLNTHSAYYPLLLQYKSQLHGRPDAPQYITHCDLLTHTLSLL